MTGIPKGWDPPAHALWIEGKRHEAVQRVLIPINKHAAKPPKPLLAQFAYYLFLLPDYRAAADVLGRAHALYPEDMEIHLNLATAQSRAKAHKSAIATAESYIAKQGSDPNIFDMLAHSHYRLGHFEAAKAAAERALAIKDEAAAAAPPLALQPIPGNLDDKANVIAFSLWGSNPRYLRGALHNVLSAKKVYSGWTCRFYVDSSVDAGVREALVELGAELHQHRILGMPQRLSRRFAVADDPVVGRFLVRDCDSVVNAREAQAVGEWIDSGKPFHIMRDWWTHTDPILAGMWGGIAGVLPSMGSLLGRYKTRQLETPNWDQWFLRDCVWPLIRDEALIHDRYFASRNATPFPGDIPAGNLHVGQDEFAVRRGIQKKILQGWLDRLPVLRMPEES
ncbi:MAG TPA: tetratricopeptide repeat protein [Sphingomicrobium sp.]|nr:tetratricopeptide repeat protein [Sphingomicrobium sp.]